MRIEVKKEKTLVFLSVSVSVSVFVFVFAYISGQPQLHAQCRARDTGYRSCTALYCNVLQCADLYASESLLGRTCEREPKRRRENLEEEDGRDNK